MAIEVFTGTSIPRELATAALEFLWAKWKTLNDTNSLTLQRLTEECSYELRSNSIHLLSVNDDFVYMYVGEAMQANAGESLAGRLLLLDALSMNFRTLRVPRDPSCPVCRSASTPSRSTTARPTRRSSATTRARSGM